MVSSDGGNARAGAAEAGKGDLEESVRDVVDE